MNCMFISKSTVAFGFLCFHTHLQLYRSTEHAAPDLSFLSTAMRSLHWNVGVLVLFLNASPLLHDIFSAHAASTAAPITRRRITFLKDHSGFDAEEFTSPSPELPEPSNTPAMPREPQLCHYNPCLENQEPCLDISERTGCLCPGISRADVPPHAPRIQVLRPISGGEDRGMVEVHWCAPSSVVSKYRVVFQNSDRKPLEFRGFLRKGSVGHLDAGDKVCVEAVNGAGRSVPTDFSCQRYNPGTSDQRMLAGVIGGGVTLILIAIIVAVSFNKCKTCQKAKTDSANGLGNPSYSTEGTL